MPMAKKKSRAITVDGVGYRWKVSVEEDPGYFNPPSPDPHGVVIEADERPGYRLLVGFPISRQQIEATQYCQITPSIVSSIICAAVQSGWMKSRDRVVGRIWIEGALLTYSEWQSQLSDEDL